MSGPKRMKRVLRAIALSAAGLMLAACAGLPTSGPVTRGLALGETPEVPDFTQVARGPISGATPGEIVLGFLEAGITPADGWGIANQFLTPEFATKWRPNAGVTIDAGLSTRGITWSGENADSNQVEVRVNFSQVASVDGDGAYSELQAPATAAFRVEKNAAGEWRISDAPDGIVLEASTFQQVFRRYALLYFDKPWVHLVPDVRWYPRRQNIATTITQAVISGKPAPWLAPVVRSAFPAEVVLARDAVPIDAAQVADVALNRAALSLEPETLARMRTQLELSLVGVGVSEVRFSVDGRPLAAGTVVLPEPDQDSGSLVLTEAGFGTVIGDELTPVPGLSERLVQLAPEIATIDLAAKETFAVVQQFDARIFVVTDGGVDELDTRADLVAPSVDPYGYIWTVPSGQPKAVLAWRADVVPHPIEAAWPDASSVSYIRASADGSRLAAVITVGGQRWIAVAAIIREDNGLPTGLGPTKLLSRLQDPVGGLVWLGPESLGALIDAENPMLLTQTIGGPGFTIAAPSDALAIAGGQSAGQARVMIEGGYVLSQQGSTWQQTVSDVQVLATRAGQ